MYGYVFHDKWPKSWSNIEDPVVPWTKLFQTLTRWSVGKAVWWTWMGKSTSLRMSIVHRKQRWFLSVYVYYTKTSGQKQSVAPMWKKLMKNVDHDEPSSFLDNVYLGCTQRECKTIEIIRNPCREMFESRTSATATTKNTRVRKNSRRNSRVVSRCVSTDTPVTRHISTRAVTAQIACTHTFIKRHARLKILTICTCGHFLHKERGANQEFVNFSMDLLSVPEYVIKKGRSHGHRYGEKPRRQRILSG